MGSRPGPCPCGTPPVAVVHTAPGIALHRAPCALPFRPLGQATPSRHAPATSRLPPPGLGNPRPVVRFAAALARPACLVLADTCGAHALREPEDCAGSSSPGQWRGFGWPAGRGGRAAGAVGGGAVGRERRGLGAGPFLCVCASRASLRPCAGAVKWGVLWSAGRNQSGLRLERARARSPVAGTCADYRGRRTRSGVCPL